MQFLPYFLPLLTCLLFLLFYTIQQTTKPNTPKPKTHILPEPPGAQPIIGHMHLLRGPSPLARKLGAMADKLGPIFSLRLGARRALVVSNWETMKECFTINDKNFATRPDMAFTKQIGIDGASFAVAPYGKHWRDMKKMVNVETFGSQWLPNLQHIWNSEVNHLIHNLFKIYQKNEKISINLSELFEHEMCNMPIRLLSGKRLFEGNIEDLRVKEAINKGLYLSGVLVISDFIPGVLEWLDLGGCLKAIRQSVKELHGIAGKWVEEHIEDGFDNDKVADFISVMLSRLAKETNTSCYTRDVTIRATVALMLTGTASTRDTMIWVVSLLLNSPDILKAAQAELDVHVGRKRWVEESDIEKLEYLQAIVKETLRLYPPGPLAGPREAIEDCYVGGYYVPKGTRLVINLWQLHHDSRVWSNPYGFHPDRFLKGHSNVNYQGQNFEYLPFGSGRRMCPATIFSVQGLHLTLARLLQGFELAPPMGKPVDMSEGQGFGLPKAKPLEAVLTPRLSSELYQEL